MKLTLVEEAYGLGRFILERLVVLPGRVFVPDVVVQFVFSL